MKLILVIRGVGTVKAEFEPEAGPRDPVALIEKGLELGAAVLAALKADRGRCTSEGGR